MALENSAAKPATSRSSLVVPQPLKWQQRLAATAIFFVVKTLSMTWRKSCQMSPEFKRGGTGPVIFSCWHNRLAVSMVANFDFAVDFWRAPGLAAMISASRDGGLLAAVLQKFRVQAVRGSSSRRGPQALLEATTWLEKGYNLAITPDGPRGPKYQVQDGIISLAQLTGIPIIPVSISIHGKICLKSWDAFQLPLPFARCKFYFTNPVFVPRELTENDRARIRDEIVCGMAKFGND